MQSTNGLSQRFAQRKWDPLAACVHKWGDSMIMHILMDPMSAQNAAAGQSVLPRDRIHRVELRLISISMNCTLVFGAFPPPPLCKHRLV